MNEAKQFQYNLTTGRIDLLRELSFARAFFTHPLHIHSQKKKK